MSKCTDGSDVPLEGMERYLASYLEFIPAIVWRIDIVGNDISFLNSYSIPSSGERRRSILQNPQLARELILADAIQNGARKCTESIAKVDAEASNSVENARKTDSALKEIAELAEITSERIAGIATAAEQQSSATEQIARTAGEVGGMAEETHEAMTQSEQNVRQVEKTIHQLHGIITKMN